MKVRSQILRLYVVRGIIAVVLTLRSVGIAQTFTAVDLGTLLPGFPFSAANAVSNGQVVGVGAIGGGGAYHAFSWTQAGEMADLGTLPGGTNSEAIAVSNGQVVGNASISGGERRAFSWTQAGGMVDLGTLPGGTYSYATAVSNGQVVGNAAVDTLNIHAFSWTAAGGMVDLGTLGGTSSSAAAVSNGQVVGSASTIGSGSFHAFSWTAAGGMVDLGTLPGFSYSFASAVSNGQVVGTASTIDSGSRHAFSWTAAGGMVDLGTLPGFTSSSAAAVSNGQVVGQVGNTSGNTHAFSWTAAGGMVDLGTLPGFTSSSAAAVSNGQVVGNAAVDTLNIRAFSWTAAGGMMDLGTLPGFTYSSASAVSNGQVVGEAFTTPDGTPNQAVLWIEGPPPPCVGDCDGSSAVTVDEIITLVNIALGNAQPSACPNGNPSGAEVDISLIIHAVNTALSACPSSDLYVAASGTLNGDGSVANPYRRITDAVVRARAERQTGGIPPQDEIRIHVTPGTYIGSFSRTQLLNHPEYEVLPIILNVPMLTLRGATVLVRDDGGLPTGSEPESETIVEPDQPLRQSESLFLITGTADGAVGNGVTVAGFLLDGREGRDFNNPLYVDRVSDFRINNNVIQGGSFGVTTRLASGTIEGNLLTHNGKSGSLVTGGSITQPATVLLQANRATGSAHGLIALAIATNNALLRGSNTLDLPPLQTKFDRNKPEDLQNIYDTLTVTLSGNDISDYSGLGIRLVAVVPENGALCFGRMGYETQDDAQPLTAVLTAHVLENTIALNGLNGLAGLAMEAGFTCREDPRPLVVTFAGSFEGNSSASGARPAALFDFGYAGVPPSQLPTYGFTRDSTYQVTDADGELAGFDYDNPLTDPLDGAVLNNTLTVNGVEAPHGVSVTPQAAGISDGAQ